MKANEIAYSFKSQRIDIFIHIRLRKNERLDGRGTVTVHFFFMSFVIAVTSDSYRKGRTMNVH